MLKGAASRLSDPLIWSAGIGATPGCVGKEASTCSARTPWKPRESSIPPAALRAGNSVEIDTLGSCSRRVDSSRRFGELAEAEDPELGLVQGLTHAALGADADEEDEDEDPAGGAGVGATGGGYAASLYHSLPTFTSNHVSR